jgi:hypothetical protein
VPISLFYSCLFIPAFLLSQSQSPIAIRGRVTDTNGVSIPYVNIGVPGKNSGTVSDLNGSFNLEIDDRFLGDSVEFSSIGYDSKAFSIKDLTKLNVSTHTIVLISRFTSLQQITVTPKQWRKRVLGNTTKSKFMSGGFSSNDLGAEAGTRIKIRKDPTYLEKISFHLSYNKLDSIKIRLNIYEIKNGKPAENILPQNIILSLSNKQVGSIEIDLSKYALVVKNDILVALQLIQGKGDFKSGVFMSASMFGSPTYYREASHATWKAYKGLSIGINATVRE